MHIVTDGHADNACSNKNSRRSHAFHYTAASKNGSARRSVRARRLLVSLGWLSQLLRTRASGGPPGKTRNPIQVVVRERGWAVATSKMRPRKTLAAAGTSKNAAPLEP